MKELPFRYINIADGIAYALLALCLCFSSNLLALFGIELVGSRFWAAYALAFALFWCYMFAKNFLRWCFNLVKLGIYCNFLLCIAVNSVVLWTLSFCPLFFGTGVRMDNPYSAIAGGAFVAFNGFLIGMFGAWVMPSLYGSNWPVRSPQPRRYR